LEFSIGYAILDRDNQPTKQPNKGIKIMKNEIKKNEIKNTLEAMKLHLSKDATRGTLQNILVEVVAKDTYQLVSTSGRTMLCLQVSKESLDKFFDGMLFPELETVNGMECFYITKELKLKNIGVDIYPNWRVAVPAEYTNPAEDMPILGLDICDIIHKTFKKLGYNKKLPFQYWNKKLGATITDLGNGFLLAMPIRPPESKEFTIYM
jgi:hypothetical protein